MSEVIKLAFNSQLNKSIKFFEDTHIYKLYNKAGEYEKNLISGTTFLGKFFPEFEGEKIAKNIAKRDNRDYQDILDEWAKKGTDAANFGTKVHLYAEEYLKGYLGKLPTVETKKEEAYFKSVKDYLDKTLVDDWEVLYTEKILFNNSIAGTVDLVLVNHRLKEYRICDWKTNKSIDQTSYSGSTFCFQPIDFLQDCNYNKYSLQLGLYTRLLRRELAKGYKVSNVILHITKKKVIELYPFDVIPYELYTKHMEQKYFNHRVR